VSGRGALGSRREARAAWAFLAPALLTLLVFFLLPVLLAFMLSFTDFDVYAVGDLGNARWVGLRNYAELLREPLFWRSLRNTLLFAFLGGPLTVGLALGAALLVNAPAARARRFFRTAFFAPVVATLVAMAVVWHALYHPQFGPIDHLLAALGLPRLDWLGDPRFALPALVLLTSWKNFGYTMIVFVAGLQGIPQELYEAARIDGARALQRFRHVTLPLLGPTFLFVSVVTLIGYLQVFAEPYVMTPEGGPLKSTLTTSLLMYERGFRWWSLGPAAAIAVLLFLVVLAVTLLQLRLQGGERT
jgi:multiple sugar transport system permease protein